MAGLVAANMLRRHEVIILERNKELPHNHTALLRFRTTAVSDATGIPFKKDTIRKGLWDKREGVMNEPTIAHLNRYSAIVTGGQLHNRSIFNLKESERYIAPVDFIELMARNLNITYDFKVYLPDLRSANINDYTEGPIISTVPMPFMMDMFGWDEKPEFEYLPVWTIQAYMRQPKITVCQTLYNTQSDEWYRATIHGQQLTLEFMFDPLEHFPAGGRDREALDWATQAFDRFFNVNTHSDSIIENAVINHIPIGKIMPIDERVRKQFILHLTEDYKIFSLGRFACWRNILLDDVVQDVKRIEAMIESGTTYEQRIGKK